MIIIAIIGGIFKWILQIFFSKKRKSIKEIIWGNDKRIDFWGYDDTLVYYGYFFIFLILLIVFYFDSFVIW